MGYTADQLASLWDTVGGTPGADHFAAAVALAESGGRPEAKSSTADVGLWQINGPTWVGKIPGVPTSSPSDLLDPSTNARAAVAISRGGTDWHAWCTAYSDGACGTKGGTYLGPGSPVLRYLSAAGSPSPVPAVPAVPSVPGAAPAGSPQSPGALTGGNPVAGSTSTGVPPASTAPTAPGFAGALGSLDSVLNPSTSAWAGLTNPLGTTEKIALMVIARGGLFLLGWAMVGAGVWLALGRRAGNIAQGGVEGAVAGGPGGAALGAAIGGSTGVKKVKRAADRGKATKAKQQRQGEAAADRADARARRARQDETDDDVEHARQQAASIDKVDQRRKAKAAFKGTVHEMNPRRERKAS